MTTLTCGSTIDCRCGSFIVSKREDAPAEFIDAFAVHRRADYRFQVCVAKAGEGLGALSATELVAFGGDHDKRARDGVALPRPHELDQLQFFRLRAAPRVD